MCQLISHDRAREVSRAQVTELIQRRGGSAPLVKALIQKMAFIPIIDRNLPLDPRRVGPTHGETVAGMVACLAQGICMFHLLRSFGVRMDQIHDDTTSFKVFGRYEAEPAAAKETGAAIPPAESQPRSTPVRLAPGHRKDHRPDLNQVKGGLAVSADGGVPLIWQAQDGNQADGSTYVEYWLKVKDLVGRADFLFVGDGQWATQETLVAILQHQGRFLAPLPGYAGIQRQVEEGVLTNTGEELIPWRDASGKVVGYRGFRRPYALVDPEGGQYPCDIHLFNPRLQAEKQALLERRLQKTQVCLEGLTQRLGKRVLKSREAIEQALEATLKRYHTRDFLTYRIISTETARKRYRGCGRPRAGASYQEVTEVHWTVEWQWRPEAIDRAKWLGGSFPLITSDPTLTTARVLSISKEQYHPEQRFKGLKGAGLLAPVLLKKPHRIEAFFFVVGLGLQLFTLVEREAARQITASGEPIIGLKPNHLPDYRPKTDVLLHAFRHVTVTEVILADHPAEIVISPLTPLQRRLLHLTRLEESIYTLEYITRPLGELDSS